MNTISTKEQLFKSIFNASYYDTLGFFVGAGFSKAVMENNDLYRTYKWEELLKECCSRFSISWDDVSGCGTNPEKATKICQIISEKNNVDIESAIYDFKREIGRLTTIYPDGSQRTKYNNYFNQIHPTWVTTTNYDTVIESVLGGKALTIAPQNMYIKTKNTIPVYHIHGICNSPEEIVITNSDYAKLFRPGEYRYSRLPFLMKESLVLLIGYKVGDINVLTAIDWANNLYKNSMDTYDFPIIQLVRKPIPRDDIYEDENGIMICEISSIESFFEDLINFLKRINKNLMMNYQL